MVLPWILHAWAQESAVALGNYFTTVAKVFHPLSTHLLY